MTINLKPDFLITKPEKLDLDCAIVLNGEDFNPPHVGLLLGNKIRSLFYSILSNFIKKKTKGCHFQYIFKSG